MHHFSQKMLQLKMLWYSHFYLFCLHCIGTLNLIFGSTPFGKNNTCSQLKIEKSWLNLCVVCLCVPYWAWRKERRAKNCLRIVLNCGRAWTISRLQVLLQRSWCSCVHCAQGHQEVYSPWHCSQPLWTWTEEKHLSKMATKDCSNGG